MCNEMTGEAKGMIGPRLLSGLVLVLGFLGTELVAKGECNEDGGWKMTVSAASGDILNSVSNQREADEDTLALAGQHRDLLEAALTAAGQRGASADIFVVTAPAFTDTTAGPVSWPPAGARLASPWLTISRTGSGRLTLTLLVSDLRLIADGALQARGAAPAEYRTGPGWRSMTFSCLAQAAESYVSHVSASQPPESWVAGQDCVPETFAGPMAWLFRSAPQNFFAPFDMTVLKRIEAARGSSIAFYEALYRALIHHGVPLLGSDAGSGDAWWHDALREVTE